MIDSSNVRGSFGLGLLALSSLLSVACVKAPCSGEEIQNGNCGCSLALPVDTAQLVATGGTRFWPWGVHAISGHQEGHPGLDFISSVSIPVVAAADGEVTKVESGEASEYVAGAKSLYVKAECGITYDYQPIVLDPAIGLGARVKRGQQIGMMAEMVPPYGPGRFSFHFDTRGEQGSFRYSSACPANFFAADDVAKLKTLVAESSYDEKVARTVSLTCKDGSSKPFTYPAEDQVCNAHLDPSTAAALDACIQLPAYRPIW